MHWNSTYQWRFVFIYPKVSSIITGHRLPGYKVVSIFYLLVSKNRNLDINIFFLCSFLLYDFIFLLILELLLYRSMWLSLLSFSFNLIPSGILQSLLQIKLMDFSPQELECAHVDNICSCPEGPTLSTLILLNIQLRFLTLFVLNYMWQTSCFSRHTLLNMSPPPQDTWRSIMVFFNSKFRQSPKCGNSKFPCLRAMGISANKSVISYRKNVPILFAIVLFTPREHQCSPAWLILCHEPFYGLTNFWTRNIHTIGLPLRQS